jgi:outer membrane phospholipase A
LALHRRRSPEQGVTMQLAGVMLAIATIASEPAAAETQPEVTPLFTQDRDNYFVTGLPNPFDKTTDRPRIRFQFSFKYNVVPNRTGFGLFFGFTQKSIWDLWNWAGSAPFEDSNYNPAVFLAWRPGGYLQALEPAAGPRFLGIRAGVDHELFASARGGLYVPFDGTARSGGTEERFIHLMVEAKGWHAFGIEERDPSGGGNPDLLRYMGQGQLTAEIGYDVPVRRAGSREHYQRLVGLGALARVGDRRDRYYVEAWLRYRPRAFGELGMALFVQAVTGWGETLLRYDVFQAPTVRFGIALDDLLTTESLSTGG